MYGLDKRHQHVDQTFCGGINENDKWQQWRKYIMHDAWDQGQLMNWNEQNWTQQLYPTTYSLIESVIYNYGILSVSTKYRQIEQTGFHQASKCACLLHRQHCRRECVTLRSSSWWTTCRRKTPSDAANHTSDQNASLSRLTYYEEETNTRQGNRTMSKRSKLQRSQFGM